MNSGVPDLVQASSHEEIVQIQVDAITGHAKQLGRSLSIVEAGCGQCWLLNLPGVDYSLTGIDLDANALKLRVSKEGDLDTAICGDLCTVELPEGSFDVVYSYFVLEHVPRADLALQNFIKWLKPGGILIMRLPDPTTVRGFLTPVLPHWIHVWVHRYVWGNKMAGKPGHVPYPVAYHPVIERERLCRFLAERGMEVYACYGDAYRREG